MPLAPGDRLGPYEILAPVGAGWMGSVYKARDTRLDRIVAIKVSKAEFSQRFEREARAVAALNHTNICHLYDVGPNYLAMEYVEGAPLAPTDDIHTLLDQAMQMADGMAAAHALGITHRDLKPGKIFVTRDGRVKILDFGLAVVDSDSRAAETDATQTMALTDPGTTAGPRERNAQVGEQEVGFGPEKTPGSKDFLSSSRMTGKPEVIGGSAVSASPNSWSTSHTFARSGRATSF